MGQYTRSMSEKAFLNVLIDTSVWSLALRRSPQNLNLPEKASELTEIIPESRARVIGLIGQELLSGIKNPAQLETLKEIDRYPGL